MKRFTRTNEANNGIVSRTLAGGSRRLPKLPLILVALACGLVGSYLIARSFSATPDTTGEQSTQADAFVDSIGVNTHLNYNDGVYANYSQVKAALTEAGIRHIRDYPVPAEVSKFNDLAASGIKLNAIMGVAAARSWMPHSLDQLYGVVRDQIRSAVGSVEGVNEWDINGDPNWVANLRAHQQALWNKMKADPLTSSIPVYGPSVVRMENMPALGNIGAWTDAGNIHPYPGGRPPSFEVNQQAEVSKASNVPGKPVVATETGYHTALNVGSSFGHRPASEAAEAAYIPRLFLYYYSKGLPQNFTYELMDQGTDQSDAEATFGIVRHDFSRKPAFTALKNLITLLKDPGASFTPQRLNYGLAGGNGETNKVLLQKRDGSFWLAVWQESSVWDPGSLRTLSPPSVPMTLTLPNNATAIRTYMPNQGTTALTTQNNTNTLNFNSGAQVTLIQVSPGALSDTAAPTVSITAPSNTATVSGTSTAVSASASDDTGVTGVQFKLDGVNLGAEDTTAPYGITWNTTTVATGSHSLTAVARDAAGNTRTSSAVTVTVAAPTVPPSSAARKIYGVNNSIGWGEADEARQKLGVNGDRVCQDETNLTSGLTDLASQGMYFTMCVNSYDGLSSLNVQSYANLVAEMADTYGPGGSYWNSRPQYAQYAVQSFELMNEPYGWWYRGGDNDPAAFAHLAAAAIRAGKAANPQAKFYLPLASGDVKLKNGTWVDWNRALLTAEPDLFNLADGFSLHLYDTPAAFASTLDQRKAWAWSQPGGSNKPFIITEANLTDQQASPESAYVAAMPQFVQIADERPWVKELFIFCWRGYSGRDYLGFLSTSGTPRQERMNAYRDAIQRVSSEQPPPSTPTPDTTNPTVSFTAPTNGSTVSGIVTSTVAATDNIGATKVEISLDGSLKMTDNDSPYNYSFDSKTLSNGNHTLKAKAYDAAGNTASTTITVTVNNPDTTPPNAPTGLSGAASNATTINLSWSASADSGSNQTGVTKYNVLRNGVVVAQPTTTSYSDTGRTANTAYSYTIQAVDGAGNVSNNSNTATITTPPPPVTPDTTAPSVPTGLVATAASINQVNLTWNPSTDSGGSGLSGYNVYRNGTKLNSTPMTATSYGDGTVNAGTSYSYKVEAVDGAGNKSAQTTAANVTTPQTIRGDVTGPSGAPDGKINLTDVSFIIRNYGTSDARADVSGSNGAPDGKVDIFDMSYTIRNYGG